MGGGESSGRKVRTGRDESESVDVLVSVRGKWGDWAGRKVPTVHKLRVPPSTLGARYDPLGG